MIEWLNELSDQQVRALASQVKVTGWATRPIEKLRDLLAKREEAQKVYESVCS